MSERYTKVEQTAEERAISKAAEDACYGCVFNFDARFEGCNAPEDVSPCTEGFVWKAVA